MALDNLDKNLLNIIQAEFPLRREPFSALGLRLEIDTDEVIRRIEKLKTTGIIRLIGPVFNPKRLGYQTTLVAANVLTEHLDKAEQVISKHPMVSHCYERTHDFNLWFTLAIPATLDTEAEVLKLGNRIKSETTLNLPAIRTFKIGAHFSLGDPKISAPDITTPDNNTSDTGLELSFADRAIISELQQDLLVIAKPFDLMAKRLSMDIDKFLNHCQNLVKRRVMRRFSASINHNKLGFMANAMTCWAVPSAMAEAAGKMMATLPEISHCYERRINSIWRYNLFAMIHANNKKTCQAIIDKICSDTGLETNPLVVLFSTKEIKKTRVRYII